MRELKPGDVAGLDEHAVLEQERREIASTRHRVLGGIDGSEQTQEPEDNVNEQVGIQPNQPTSGESRRHISWLWYQGGLEIEDGALSREMNDGTYQRMESVPKNQLISSDTPGVWVEWLKARARAQRWEEEV